MGESPDSADKHMQTLSASDARRVSLALCCALPSLVCSTLAYATLARAHGPAPAIVGVVAADSTGPRILALTEGFALLGADGVEFVCPAGFGVDRVPLAASTAHTTWVAGSPAATLWTADGKTITDEARVSDNSVIAFAADGGRLLALTYGSDGSDVLALDDAGATLLFHLSDAAVTLAVNGESVWVAAVRGYLAHVQRSNTRGDDVVVTDVSFTSTPRTLSLRSAGERVFLHATFDNRSELYELGTAATAALVRQEAPIFGPVSEDGVLWVGTADGLAQLTAAGAAPDPVLLDSAIHCLEERAGVAYVCSQTSVFRVADVARVGGAADVLWTLSALHDPPSATAAASDAACTAQWLTFRADLLRAGIVLTETDAGIETALTSIADGADAARAEVDTVTTPADAAAPSAETTDADTISNRRAASTCTLPALRSQRFAYLPSALFGALCAVSAYRRRPRARSRSRIS